jgi:hypothetical protein
MLLFQPGGASPRQMKTWAEDVAKVTPLHTVASVKRFVFWIRFLKSGLVLRPRRLGPVARALSAPPASDGSYDFITPHRGWLRLLRASTPPASDDALPAQAIVDGFGNLSQASQW